MHPKEEEIVRAIYQKHAHAFFDEMKESFAKESSALRRQALKMISKSTAQASTSSQHLEDSSPVSHELQAELERLRQEVNDLREASGQASNGKLRSLGEKVQQHQNDLKAISKHLKAESAAVKKATLTPVWKERTLQEIAHGELRSVCEEQVIKVFEEFRGELVKKHIVPGIKEGINEVMKEQSDIASEIEATERSLTEMVTKLDKDVSARLEKAASEAEEALRQLKKSVEAGFAQKEDFQKSKAFDNERFNALEQTADSIQREIHTVREDLRVPPGALLQRFADTPPVVEVMVDCAAKSPDEMDVVVHDHEGSA